MNTTEQNTLRLAALLHDIGKFWQGTGKKGTHQELTATFIREFLPDSYENLTFSKCHHDTKLAYEHEYDLLKILMLSDWLSSGERTPLPEKENQRSQKRTNTPLLSIFSEINLEDKSTSKSTFFPITSYDLNTKVMPTNNDVAGDFKKSYFNLWQKFISDLKVLNKEDKNIFFISLFSLLKKYTSFIPSAVWKQTADVSLFDHSKTTCAIADSLYNQLENLDLQFLIETYLKEGKDETLTEKEKQMLQKPMFSLIAGDISGIQQFIYTIVSKHATKALKGRSLYLELFTEAVAYHLIEQLQVSSANILYCAGGRFYILAAHTQEKIINDVRTSVSKRILNEFNGQLYVALENVDVSISDFKEGHFSEKWTQAGRKLQQRKKKKFSEILNEVSFEPRETIDVCHVCGQPIHQKKDLHQIEDVKKCSSCLFFEKLAMQYEQKYLIWKKNDKENNPDVFPVFDRYITFKDNLPDDHNALLVESINDTSSFITKEKLPCSFRFLLATPRTQFDALANQAEGLKRWGVIKGDVDNLGLIFSEGLQSRATLSRVTALSNMMSFFFSGWMHHICSEYQDFVYPVYSGGDDFFIIASWDKLPEISQRIYTDFRKFTGYNPSITLSVGTTIAPSKKYPISQIASYTETTLEKAKNSPGKDTFVFLDEPFKWSDFSACKKTMNSISTLIEKKQVSHGFLQKLSSIHQLYKKDVSQHQSASVRYDDRFGKWRWMLSYIIARENISKQDEWRNILTQNIAWLHVITRWIELQQRR